MAYMPMPIEARSESQEKIIISLLASFINFLVIPLFPAVFL